MVQETKDSIANITTIAGAGSAMIGFNEILSLVLIVTGIVGGLARKSDPRLGWDLSINREKELKILTNAIINL